MFIVVELEEARAIIANELKRRGHTLKNAEQGNKLKVRMQEYMTDGGGHVEGFRFEIEEPNGDSVIPTR
jgi:hypothetical protein